MASDREAFHDRDCLPSYSWPSVLLSLRYRHGISTLVATDFAKIIINFKFRAGRIGQENLHWAKRGTAAETAGF